MAAVVKVFGFVNKHPKRGIIADSVCPNQALECEALKPDFGHQCCEFNEETDPDFPDLLMKETQATDFVDSNHGHDMKAGKSIAGLTRLLGSIPVAWFAKRQSSVITCTFGAEFVSLKKAVEEDVV